MTLRANSGLNSYQLKCIALLTMTLDHVYKIFSGCWIPAFAEAAHISEQVGSLLTYAVFGAGTVTIYIFMWFIAEGCRHTHNKKVYILRLLLFGAVSEIPFQFMVNAIYGEPLSLHFGLTNVMFTLALGAAACCGYQLCKDKGMRFWGFVIPAACAALAYVLKTDYDCLGVAGVFILYLIQDRKKRLAALACMAVFFTGSLLLLPDILTYGFELGAVPYYLIYLAYALAAVPLLSLYRGVRGKKMKYLFYLYYPVHMCVLVFLYTLL